MGLLRSLLVGSVVIGLGSGWVACSGGQEAEKPGQAAPAPTPPPEPTPEAGAKLPSEQLRRHIELPEYYPPDAPIYPGTQPSEAQQLPNGRVTAIFGTPDSPEQVMTYMQEALPAQGWTITVEQSMQNGTIMQALKPERLLSILLSRYGASEAEELTIIAISVDR